jgi:anion-transporting  ArsA/GET3 family ATPase
MEDQSFTYSQNEALDQLIGAEFVFITGKGGVGKSTISALLGLVAAGRKKRALIVYPEGSPAAEQLWGKKLTETPERVAENLDAVAIAPEGAMRQYVAEALGSSKLAAVLFHQRIAQGLLTGIPGPSDWAILGKAWSFTKSGVRDGKRKERPYDLVILDAPASGDGSGMLRVPQVILELAPAARLRHDAESCLRLLKDARRARVVFVTLVEHLPISETEENLRVVRDELGMPVGPIFVNQVITPQFSETDRQLLLGRENIDLTPELLSAEPVSNPGTEDEFSRRAILCENVSRFQATQEALQEKYLKRIRSWQVPLIELPRLPEEESGENALRSLQKALAARHADGYR